MTEDARITAARTLCESMNPEEWTNIYETLIAVVDCAEEMGERVLDIKRRGADEIAQINSAHYGNNRRIDELEHQNAALLAARDD